MNEVFNFLKTAGSYYLGTVDGTKPVIRPMGSILVYEDKIYFQTSATKPMSKQMHKNPAISIVAVSESGWIRISAKAVEDSRKPIQLKMIELIPSLKSVYGEDNALAELFYLKDATATIYSYKGEPKVIKF
jgi:uncharacterized pyridoxamine 5'-phosphate oxidase family protein